MAAWTTIVINNNEGAKDKVEEISSKQGLKAVSELKESGKDLITAYVSNLVEALKNLKEGKEEAKLDIIANAISYTDLLTRHIDKEDGVIYKFAERELKESTLAEIEAQCGDFEKKNLEKKEKYIKVLKELEELEKKYS